jgi:hypothetical protein
LFWQIKITFKTSFDQESENSPFFPSSNFLPHKRAVFAVRGFLIKKIKYTNTRILKFAQVVVDPVALSLISPPLALSTKIEELFGLLTSLPHKNHK